MYKKMTTILFPLFFVSVGCQTTRKSTSNIKVTEVPITSVKRQSIGNCWLYSAAGWVEALHFKATGKKVNVSESYWMYLTWRSFIHNNTSYGDLPTGGTFNATQNLIKSDGMVLEADFIPEEANEEMSARQEYAHKFLTKEMNEGRLKDLEKRKDFKFVTKIMDEAFGVNIESIKEKIIWPKDFAVDGGDDITNLEKAIDAWFPVNYMVTSAYTTPEMFEMMKYDRDYTLKRVFKALNDGYPVVMQFWVDFNAVDPATGYFDYEYYKKKNEPGYAGGHQVILVDYTVKITDENGNQIELKEGDLNPKDKAMAADKGDLIYLVAKNSWGSFRPDRGITDGLTRIKRDYLDNPLYLKTSGGGKTLGSSPVQSFIIPPGY